MAVCIFVGIPERVRDVTVKRNQAEIFGGISNETTEDIPMESLEKFLKESLQKHLNPCKKKREGNPGVTFEWNCGKLPERMHRGTFRVIHEKNQERIQTFFEKHL